MLEIQRYQSGDISSDWQDKDMYSTQVLGQTKYLLLKTWVDLLQTEVRRYCNNVKKLSCQSNVSHPNMEDTTIVKSYYSLPTNFAFSSSSC